MVVKRDTSVMVEAAEGASVGQLAEGLVLGLKDVKESVEHQLSEQSYVQVLMAAKSSKVISSIVKSSTANSS